MYPDVEKWQARRESNPQPAVLETAALPIELLAYIFCSEGSFFAPLFLLNNLGYHAGPDGPTTFSNRKAQSLVHSNRTNQFGNHIYIISRHYHFNSFWKLNAARDICSAKVKLWTITLKKWRMSATLIFA